MKLLAVILLLLSYKGEVPPHKLGQRLQQYYGVPVQIRSAAIPRGAFYAPRSRYRADSVLAWIQRTYPKDTVVALTSLDISASLHGYPDWGVMGLGLIGGKASLTSTYRLRSKNLEERTFRVLVHEAGHGYGLPHCTSPDLCVMKAGNHTARFIDHNTASLCIPCRAKLKKLRQYETTIHPRRNRP